MFDLVDPQEPHLRAYDWKDWVASALKGQERAIAGHLLRDQVPERIQVEPIKQARGSLTVKLSVATSTAVLKLYALNSADGEMAYLREKSTLIALRGKGVTPFLLGFCDERRFLFMQYILCFDENAVMDSLGLEGLAYAIGAWLGRFDRLAPSQPAHGNWATYLGKYKDDLAMDGFPAAHDVLSQIPLCGQTLAQCDSALGNVLIRPDGQAVGVDFEEARFRPRGWDFAMYFISLVERAPDQAETLLEALADGFESEHRGALIVDELKAVARLILCLRASSFVVDEENEDGC